jgi:hypothetical protein
LQSIKDWAAPGSVKNVLQFLGSVNFYCRFADGFSRVARPLTEPTAFDWAEAARSALATSKHLCTAAPILVHFHPEKPTVIETAASDLALAAVLSQTQETKRLHPVAYHSRKFMPAEINYDVQLLAVVTAFKEYTRSLRRLERLQSLWKMQELGRR